MMNVIDDLQQEIERLVRGHLEAQRRAAAAAVERAFASVVGPGRMRTARMQTERRRRAPTEMSELADRLYEAVRAHPGETIAAIAAEVGATAKTLNRPMAQLKREGRVRSAGQRRLTRYFPMTHASKGT